MEPVGGEDLKGGVQELAAPLRGRKSNAHVALHGIPPRRVAFAEGTGADPSELVGVATRPTNPSPQMARPPEPIRPLPAQRTGVSLLSLRARRRRYRDGLPRKRGN